ncbi:MAG: Ribonuclease III (EC [uncultured Paraburkholderia sp.]|nr:MAG: Ribonuclease III (EC [uncultured Paraburkholderia sp.]CAH2937085.1 MAG: Ribonuclease III (EC [uncultured Paraburkholderia sp.]
MPLSPLESRLRYEFRNAELLRQALTHRSHSATHNERLEFLGDSVLNCAVAALLFQRFGKLDEGDLSRVRANLVKQQSLYEIARALNISEGLRLGEGELRSGGFRRPSILADTLEAVLGAIFLDGGFEAAQTVIKRLYIPILDHIDPRTLGKDSKTLLQEYLQSHKIALPTYIVVATQGAAHNQQFEVQCTVPKLDVKVSGSGASRRAAEQAAAKKALDEVMAAAPAVVGKSKRLKGTRASKNAELKIVPGLTGVQAALDLRSLDRKVERGAARGESRATANAGMSASTASSASANSGATRAGAERVAQAGAVAPLAVIRAAHVEYSSQDKQDRVERSDKQERLEKPAAYAAEKSTNEKNVAEKPVTEKSADLKVETKTETRTEPKSAEVKGSENKASEAKESEAHLTAESRSEAAATSSAEKPRSREVPASAGAAATEHEPSEADAVQTRVADAGH